MTQLDNAMTSLKCECGDPGCIVNHDNTCQLDATVWVRRVDMEDGSTEFAFCEDCAEDAMDSGVFDSRPLR